MVLGDRIAVMKTGEIQQVGAPMTVYQHPANLFVAGFVGSPPMNFLRGTLSRKGYTLLFGGDATAVSGNQSMQHLRVSDEATSALTGYIERQVILGMRPEHVRLMDSNAEESFWATIRLVEAHGADSWVHLESGAHRFVARVETSGDLRVGATVPVIFDMGRGHFFDPVTGRALRS
jgi:multiple sugar transport system ATP-binding protein